MTPVVCDNSGDSPAGNLVPDNYPPVHRAPEPVVLIPFGKALLLSAIRGNYAPHLAAGSMRRAIVAYCLSVSVALLSIGLVWGLAVSRTSLNEINSVRKCVAIVVIDLMYAIDRPQLHPLVTLAIIFLVPAIIAYVSAGLLEIFLPSSTGDSAWSKCKRWTNSVLWSSTALLWVGCVNVVSAWAYFAMGPWSYRDLLDTPLGGHAHSAVLLLFLTVIAIGWMAALSHAGVHTYVGAASGPGYSPRRPMCRRCGYALNGLWRDARCPECGLDIEGSLPQDLGNVDSMDLKEVSVEYEDDVAPDALSDPFAAS